MRKGQVHGGLSELLRHPDRHLSRESAKFTEGQRPASIPAWGNAPGTRAIGDRGLKARSILDGARCMGRAFSPLAISIHDPLGRCPRLVWVAPLAHRQAGLSVHALNSVFRFNQPFLSPADCAPRLRKASAYSPPRPAAPASSGMPPRFVRKCP